ncbi:MAG: tRNA1(Val) (adenine(37)-N6)-methyltransferase [Clostridia bacterium]|nr:tRNA1(Val) (adenine(37)-N6)-methyltransferase [Clostridia bacterium]
MELKEDERIDDLQCNGLKIIQNKKEFCFGIDAVLLSDFAKKTKRNAKVIDLCTGTGIIAILLTAKSSAKKIIGVEIQKHIAEMATRSVKMNNLSEQVQIINEDLTKLKNIIPAGTIDTITVNPPYKPKNSGVINEKDTKTIARHEISCTLEDIVKESARLLNTGGNLCMVHKVERMTDLFVLFRKYKLEPKRMRLVYSKFGEPATLVLIEGVKGGKPFLKMEPPIFVYEKDNEYTKQIKEIYGINEA